ncbi:MAG: AAA family ATPase [candidate division WOR-3 bacterium]
MKVNNSENNSILNYLQLLLKPSFWGKYCHKVNLIQTHTSWVFLTGKYAYKIKKPVFFGFLDYTTLSARKHFCEEEFRINQTLAPDIYYQVIPIVKKGKQIMLSKTARLTNKKPKSHYTILDYAIKMKELPQQTIMTNLLLKRQVNYSTIDQIAKIIAHFHKSSKFKAEYQKYGSIETIKYNWDENFAQTEPFIDITIKKQSYAKIKAAVEQFYHTHQDLFQKRIVEHKIKQCHGDLHSRNIFIQDQVYIFDCLEFNPRFAVSDVASEIAFFVMDLEFYRHKHLADFFINRYLHYTQDYELLKLLDFYKCYRAYVRGKVTSFNLNDRGMSRQEKASALKIARQYFALAEKYLDCLNSKPTLIMIMGLPGVGKTYLAQHLADAIGAYHFSTDIIRKEITNTPIEKHCFEGYGKGIYTKEISAQTYQTLYERTENYLTQSKAVIIDATFSYQQSRNEAKELAIKNNADFYIINCTCPERLVLQRMKKRQQEFSLSDATPEIYYRIRENFEAVKDIKNYLEIDTSRPIKTNLKKIIYWLKPKH